MKKVLYFNILTLFSILALTACTLQPKNADGDWYVRSEFTWWEARNEFILKETEHEGLYSMMFKLTPDGSAYHIKVADRLWSIDKNCGKPVMSNVSLVALETWYPLSCDYAGETIMPLQHSYKFIPDATGLYQMEVKFVDKRPNAFKLSFTPNT